MVYFTLKNGIRLALRQAEEKDYERVQTYIRQLATETIFTKYYPGQPIDSRDKFNRDIQNGLYYLALEGEKVVGLVSATILLPEHPWKNKVCRFGIHMLKAYYHQGLGHQLMDILDAWARSRQLHKIEAIVRDENIPALSLYIQHGFMIEGFRHDTTLIEGVWHGDYDIGKILN